MRLPLLARRATRPPAADPVVFRFRKNGRWPHDWSVEGTEPVGPEQWARIRCQVCGEARTVGAELSDPRVKYGCYRQAGGDALQKGDLVIVDGGALDEVTEVRGNGDVVSYNLGGGYHVTAGPDVQLYA